MQRAVGFALLAIVGFLPLSAHALCWPKQLTPPDTADPFGYLDSVVDSLGWAKQGLRHIDEAKDLGDLVYGFKAAHDDYDCAASILKSFAVSSDEATRTSAVSLIETYHLLAVGSQAALKETVNLIDQASKGKTPAGGTMLERLASLRLMNEGTWKTLPLAVIAATYVLPKYDDGKPTGRFRITKAQRRELTRALQKHFGPSVRAGMKGEQRPLDAAAGALYQFLADRKWRSVDDP